MVKNSQKSLPDTSHMICTLDLVMCVTMMVFCLCVYDPAHHLYTSIDHVFQMNATDENKEVEDRCLTF